MSTRYITLLACIMLQVCGGGVYAWSNMVIPLQESFGFTNFQVQLVFGTVVMMLTTTTLLTGRLQQRYHPLPVAAVGSCLFATGFAVASISGDNFFLLWLGAGFIMGMALGCTYVCAMATGVKWFPRHKGLVTGLVAGGYGGGAVLMSQITKAMQAADWTVPEIFRTVGLGFGLIMLLCSLLLRIPPDDQTEIKAIVPLRKVFVDRKFWQTFLVFLLGNLPGLMIIGAIKPIGIEQGLTVAVAVLAISVLSVGNALGRVFWGWMFDLIGRERALLSSMLLITLTPGLVWLSGDQPWAFLLAAFLVGIGFSSCLVLHAAFIAAEYGPNRFGAVYPWVTLAHGFGALIGPTLGGTTRDWTGSYDLALLLATLAAALGLVAFFLLAPARRPTRKTASQIEGDDPLSVPPA